MSVQYRPPLNDSDECDFLETNFIKCLKEKSVKDQVDKISCKVENIMWFVLECPKRFETYESEQGLKRIFKLAKENPNAPLPTKNLRRDSD